MDDLAEGGEAVESACLLPFESAGDYGAGGVGSVVGKGARERCSVWLSRVGNLVFVLGWLHYTRAWFVDDLSRGAVWLFEPVPVSVVRLLGFGENGDDTVWRWGWDEMPGSWTQGRWWERGLKI